LQTNRPAPTPSANHAATAAGERQSDRLTGLRELLVGEVDELDKRLDEIARSIEPKTPDLAERIDAIRFDQLRRARNLTADNLSQRTQDSELPAPLLFELDCTPTGVAQQVPGALRRAWINDVAAELISSGLKVIGEMASPRNRNAFSLQLAVEPDPAFDGKRPSWDDVSRRLDRLRFIHASAFDRYYARAASPDVRSRITPYFSNSTVPTQITLSRLTVGANDAVESEVVLTGEIAADAPTREESTIAPAYRGGRLRDRLERISEDPLREDVQEMLTQPAEVARWQTASGVEIGATRSLSTLVL
jgi:hypothetical protein